MPPIPMLPVGCGCWLAPKPPKPGVVAAGRIAINLGAPAGAGPSTPTVARVATKEARARPAKAGALWLLSERMVCGRRRAKAWPETGSYQSLPPIPDSRPPHRTPSTQASAEPRQIVRRIAVEAERQNRSFPLHRMPEELRQGRRCQRPTLCSPFSAPSRPRSTLTCRLPKRVGRLPKQPAALLLRLLLLLLILLGRAPGVVSAKHGGRARRCPASMGRR